MPETAHPEALDQMRSSPYNYPDTRWAAYQNMAMDSQNLGHLQFLAVGPQNTCKEPTRSYPADTPAGGCGWKYQFIGWVDLDTGEIKEERFEQARAAAAGSTEPRAGE